MTDHSWLRSCHCRCAPATSCRFVCHMSVHPLVQDLERYTPRRMRVVRPPATKAASPFRPASSCLVLPCCLGRPACRRHMSLGKLSS